MRRDDEAQEAVEAAWEALQPRLSALAYELGTSSDSWQEDYGDAVSVGSEVKDLAGNLAGALSEWLPELPTHRKLDAFLYELAARHKGKSFNQAAEAAAGLLEFLRQISYGTLPDVDDAPDPEEVSQALEEMLKELGIPA